MTSTTTKTLQRIAIGAATFAALFNIANALSARSNSNPASVAALRSAQFSNRFSDIDQTELVLHANDAAYRDGLFVGRLHAEAGKAPLTTTSRWSTNPDRASFMTAYNQSYQLSSKTARRVNSHRPIPA
jgi:hypothetical protein